jgi:hypothetical protein
MKDVDDDSKSHKVFDLTVRHPLVQYESFDCTRAGTVYMCTLGSSVHRETMKTPHTQCKPLPTLYSLFFFFPPLTLAVPRNSFALFLRSFPAKQY